MITKLKYYDDKWEKWISNKMTRKRWIIKLYMFEYLDQQMDAGVLSAVVHFLDISLCFVPTENISTIKYHYFRLPLGGNKCQMKKRRGNLSWPLCQTVLQTAQSTLQLVAGRTSHILPTQEAALMNSAWKYASAPHDKSPHYLFIPCLVLLLRSSDKRWGLFFFFFYSGH